MPEAAIDKRYGISAKSRYWWRESVDRFNLAKEPNEPNRFGWMTEYDPYDANSVPVKRTALGRFKHEGAAHRQQGRPRRLRFPAMTSGSTTFYRFVTSGRYDPRTVPPTATCWTPASSTPRSSTATAPWNGCRWSHGQGPLTPANGFKSQADVLIETRRAADMVGATPMDRPEDVEPNPVNGRVYVMLTNNTQRKATQVDAVNPRPANRHGQIVELIPPGGEGAEADDTGGPLQLDPRAAGRQPSQGGGQSRLPPGDDTWLSSPDNCAFDPRGRLWISTDQGEAQTKNGIPDGMYACDLSGPGRALVKFFFSCPIGAEMCGPEFTPDGKTLFVGVQHPSEVEEFQFRETRHPLARLPGWNAPKAVGGGNHEAGWRRDRGLKVSR